MYKIILSTILIASPMISYATVCGNVNSIPDDINYDITEQIQDNVVGNTFDVQKSGSETIGVEGVCPKGTTESYTLRSYITNHPVVDTINNINYLQLNDYLIAGLELTDQVAGTFYPPQEYVKMGSDPDHVPNNLPFAVRDTNLIFHFKIVRPFVGHVEYNLTPAFYVYVTTKKTDPLNKVLYTISYSGSITVPQSCEVNAGQTVVMDFGKIGSSEFSRAGAGNKPKTVNPLTKNINIRCKNMDAQAILTLSIDADNVSGNAVVSDNEDLGFKFSDLKENILIPNDINSNIPFKLDNNYSANVPIKAWPVSITGKKPKEGEFTSHVYLKVNYE